MVSGVKVPKHAIQVENLGKEYAIGGVVTPTESFREMLMDSIMSPLGTFKKLSGNAAEVERFWALKNLNFEVRPGDVLGVIGHNGAGKSTLLKILGRITQPTVGRIQVCGKLASLLEVGTGFHPELTGRENIYLNGAILGMSRDQVAQKFDEIVAFAEIEKFIDTPVKRYSSGMYVRLAFSVAAHLDADILLVDEVLAVGDVEFQRRCLGKMREVSGGGRTVVFVSHNFSAIQALCTRCLLLENGGISAIGPAISVVGAYLAELADDVGITHSDVGALKVASIDAEYRELHDGNSEIQATVSFVALANLGDVHFDFGIENESDVRVFQAMPAGRGERPIALTQQMEYCYRLRIQSSRLSPGMYYCTVYVHSRTRGVLLHRSRIRLFNVPVSAGTAESAAPGFTAVLLPNYQAALEPRLT